MRRLLVLGLLALLFPLLAGCIGSDSGPTAAEPGETSPDPDELPDPVTVIEDAEGDATQRNSEWIQHTTVRCTVDPAPGDPDVCQSADPLLGSQEPVGVVPADPARDVLDVRLQETPRRLNVSMDVAELGEDLDGAIQRSEDGEGFHGTNYYVDWEDPVSGCVNELWFWVGPYREIVNAVPVLWSFCQLPLDDNTTVPGPCTARWCNWRVPFDLDPGAPATLTWSIPRSMLASGGEAGTIPEPVAGAYHIPSDHGSRGASVRADGPISTGWFGVDEYGYPVDRTAVGANFTFSTPSTDAPRPPGRVASSDEDPRTPDAPERPDLLLEDLTFEPETDRFSFDVTLRTVAETPRNHTLYVGFGVSGHDISLGYVARDGDRTQFASRVGTDGNPVSIPVEMTEEPGDPGQITFELLRSDLPELPDEPLMQVLYVQTSTLNETREGVGRTGVTRAHWEGGDLIVAAPLQRIRADAGDREDDPAKRFGDDPGDVDPPQDLTGSTNRFDLLGTEIDSPAPDEMRFSMSVADLSDLSPPTGYDAVLYAVAVEHPNGRTMLGHYRSRDRPGGEFLCAPDTTVMADSRSDPTHTAWTEIDGTILTSSSSGGIQGTGGGAPGSIAVTAPPACFGLEDGAEELNVTALKTGSYLVRRPPGQSQETTVHELDALQPEDGAGDFAAAFADPPPQPAPSFWAQPFGIPNFWDIFGGILAVLTGLVTVALFLRRRRRFNWYLEEIRRIQKDHRDDPEGRAEALVDLRKQLYEDVERHRVSDSQHIMERLRARLTSARLTTIGRTFYDLPSRLSLRIEAMLDDGHLAAEECEVLEEVVEDTDLDAEVRDTLRERLRRWVAQDREHLDLEHAT